MGGVDWFTTALGPLEVIIFILGVFCLFSFLSVVYWLSLESSESSNRIRMLDGISILAASLVILLK